MDEEIDAVAAAMPALRACAHHARMTLRDAIGNASGQPSDQRWVLAHAAVRTLLDGTDNEFASPLPLHRLRAFVDENADLGEAV